MQIPAEIASDLRHGAIFKVNERHGLRRIDALWFNFVSGHYVARAGAVHLWSDGPNGPWHVIPARQANAELGKEGK
jgi:hypothetical protein